MGTLVFQANLGGAVNLIGPNTASTVNFTLPSADGTSGQALVTNGSGTLSFSTFTSGAAGSNTQVQFNSSGAFAGSANLTFDGTTLTSNALTVTNATTLSGGTANGVAYLNGSKVVTTGSALTFDGTNLGLSGTGARYINLGTTSTNGQTAALQISAPNSDASASVYRVGSGLTADNEWTVYDVTSTQTVDKYIRGSSGFRAFYQNGSEGMRLTSTGLGIGTSSPSEALTVTNDATYKISIKRAADGSYAAFGATGNNLLIYNNGSERMRLDSSGNLGLGVTPSAWSTLVKAFQTSGGSIYTNSVNMGMTQNAYYASGGWTYTTNAAATRYDQTAGTHTWSYAAAGTGLLTFTTAMTLDASGNLLVGTTSSVASNRKTISLTDDSGIATVPLTDLGQNGYVDINITNAVNGSVMAVQLMVTNTFKANAAARTSTLYAIFDRGLNNTTITSIASANGSAGGASFTVTVPSSGVIRITNTVAGICSLSAVATVVTGF